MRRRITTGVSRLSRRVTYCSGLAAALLFLASFVSCDYSPRETFDDAAPAPKDSLPGLPPGGRPPLAENAVGPKRDDDTRKALLNSAMNLIHRAALQPGGEDFKLAVQKLNQYFDGTRLSEYQHESLSREFLSHHLPVPVVDELSDRNWTLRDARHIEDCMMYYPIANRIAGTGENLERVRRVFAWTVAQTQLVPAGALGFGGLPQAFARPYDVLVRGMATEAQGVWAERAWLFMSLCRQIGIDTGLITYTRSSTLELPVPRYGVSMDLDANLFGLRRGPKAPVVWICAALIDDKAYLFDARLGLEVPGPDGTGVATLEHAMSDPAVLERMNLPGQSPYGTSRASLLGSPTKIGILIDSSRGYYSPKMKLLQRELSGEYRTILFRDPAEHRDHFAQVLGRNAGEIKLWSLPYEVETRLFTDGNFVASIQLSLFLFKREYPLIYARVKQLRGDLEGAINDYVALRFKENAPLVNNKFAVISNDVQAGLDAYATYYLALAQLEKAMLAKKPPDQAELLFRNTLELLPEPGPSQPYYHMLRWGANANLGRIYEAKKDNARAIAYETVPDPTTQGHGNLVRAREVVWRSPMAGPPVILPPAPALRPIKPAPANPGPARRPNARN
jgi:hypothetical protein